MENNKTSASGGISFSALLGLAFIILKLVGVISWSWVWVLAPFWIGIALTLIIVFVAWLISKGV